MGVSPEQKKVVVNNEVVVRRGSTVARMVCLVKGMCDKIV